MGLQAVCPLVHPLPWQLLRGHSVTPQVGKGDMLYLQKRGWIPTGTPETDSFCSCHQARFNIQPFFVTMWFSTFLPFSWGLDFPQGCLLHDILKAAGLELGKEMKRTRWWLPTGDMDLQELGIFLHELV